MSLSSELLTPQPRHRSSRAPASRATWVPATVLARVLLAVLATVAGPRIPFVGPTLVAQEAERATALPQWETRADWTTARTHAAHIGAGLNVRAGWYARVGAVLALGVAEGPGDDWLASQRADLTVRFLLDPFDEHSLGFYGGAGITARRDGELPVDARLLLLFGAEGRPVRGVLPAVELALGGGFRVGVVIRRIRPGPAR